MKWIKKDQIFTLSNSLENKKTHASNPLAIHLEEDVFRVFYSIRNEAVSYTHLRAHETEL
jgi:hypothetical protein